MPFKFNLQRYIMGEKSKEQKARDSKDAAEMEAVGLCELNPVDPQLERRLV